MEAILEVDPLTEFFESIRSPLTRDRYEHRFDIFLRHIGIDGADLRERASNFAKKAKKDPQWATLSINEYMRYQRERAEKGELSESTLPNFWKPIKLFCEQNDIILNWKKITRRIPSGRQYANDRAPTLEEIRAILRYDDPRIKPVVLTMVSSGIRVGAWDYLKWEDVKPIQDKSGNVIAASLKVYAGTKDEYKTFITPEAYRSLKAWMDSRAQAGEKVGPKSWVMRDLWEEGEGDGKQGRKKVDKHGAIPKRGIATVPKKLSSIGVTRLIERALFAQGIRGKKEDHAEEPRGEPRRKRYEFQTAHGFRKYFNTICDRYMKTLFVEFLMGHNTGLKESYNRAKDEELLEEYLKAVPALTVLERPQTEQTSIPSEEDIQTLKEEIAYLRTQRESDQTVLSAVLSGLEELKKEITKLKEGKDK
jgi:hypothetical protein